MALRSTIYKAVLQLADIDRHHYAEHAMVIARHPSETDERMMVRIAAFGFHADDALEFGRGISTDDEPDLWRKDLTGAIELWIEVGLPEEKWLRKACGRAEQVVLYAYGRGADIWWEQNRNKLNRLDNLSVYRLDTDETRQLAAMAERSMQLGCSIQEGQMLVSSASAAVQITRAGWQVPA